MSTIRKRKFSRRSEKQNFPLGQKKQLAVSRQCRLFFFFDIEGIVHHEFVPHGRTVTQVFYKDVLLKRLLEKIRKKTPRKTANRNPVSSPRQCASTFSRTCSPDPAPCDFFFIFPRF